jgi:hypothetical protein
VKYGFIGSCVLSVVLVGAFATAARAGECDKQTYLTFSAPVSLPGVALLPAGTYLFSHLDCSSNSRLLRITSSDGSRLYATLLVIPEDRPTASDEPTVVFVGGARAGSPRAIKAWFYPGARVGDKLVYPKGYAQTPALSGSIPAGN